jgi:predicted phage terminase large subunit-like protein
MLNERDFHKEYEELRDRIRNSVSGFNEDSIEDKQERLQRAEHDKIYFAQTYFPHYCPEAFAPVHAKLFAIADIYNTPNVIYGSRELAKSTILSFFDEMHKTLFKKNRFTIFIADTKETAMSEYLFPIKAELEANERILNDFGDLKSSYWGLDDFILKTGKRFLSSGPQSGVKGKRTGGSRFDRVFIEDFENQNSPKKRSIISRRIKFIVRDVMKGFNSKKWQLFYVGNYFSKKTIMHQFLTSEEFKHWNRYGFPALIPKKHPLANKNYFKKVDIKPELIVGDDGCDLVSIWEERLPYKMLLKEKEEDPATFRSERMQKPDDEDGTFNDEWFKYFDIEEIEKAGFPVVTFQDPSVGKGEEHCFKAIIALAVNKEAGLYYVVDACIWKNSKWNTLIKHWQMSELWNSFIDGIEGNGFQGSLREDWEIIEQEKGQRKNLKLIFANTNKEVRISSLSSPIERGYILFRRNHAGVRLLIEQLLDFPDGDKDGPDALEGAKSIADRFIHKKKSQVKGRVLTGA